MFYLNTRQLSVYALVDVGVPAAFMLKQYSKDLVSLEPPLLKSVLHDMVLSL